MKPALDVVDLNAEGNTRALLVMAIRQGSGLAFRKYKYESKIGI